MPTYQYACTDCGEQIEAVQKFSDAPLSECVSCGGRLRKVFSPVGIVFKGSGFYRTDSRNAGNGRAPAAASSNGSAEKAGANGSGSAAGGEKAGSGSSSESAGSKDSGSKTGSKASAASSASSSGSKVA